MSNSKTIITWLALCIVAAAGTIIVVTTLNPQFGLQQKVADFGKVK